mmetsp:Transcript_35407/g.101103  ORF Transcript_35407/g.101103 Transcript_35407/m.101103 type:complete len:97 (+) Transcript_35407:34-324(+)
MTGPRSVAGGAARNQRREPIQLSLLVSPELDVELRTQSLQGHGLQAQGAVGVLQRRGCRSYLRGGKVRLPRAAPDPVRADVTAGQRELGTSLLCTF